MSSAPRGCLGVYRKPPEANDAALSPAVGHRTGGQGSGCDAGLGQLNVQCGTYLEGQGIFDLGTQRLFYSKKSLT